MIRLLIAEDSATVQRVLTNLLETEPNIEIVGIANDGIQAFEMCQRLKPDLITMDIFMPKMNGLEATRKIMEFCPTPIVIISSMVGGRDANLTFEAMRAGAIEVMEKPVDILSGKYQEIKQNLVRIIKTSIKARPSALLAWRPPASTDESTTPSTRISNPPDARVLDNRLPGLICIGGSTGAPTVIVEILRRLPANFPIPIVVAQHISAGFAVRMTEWLHASIPMDVRIGRQGDQLIPGRVLMCPDDRVLIITQKGRIHLNEPGGSTIHVPSIDDLFSSAATAFQQRATGILLSGMGKDGARGIADIHQQKGLTIGQNEATSVVYGMNRVAIEKGVVELILSPDDIADTLLTIADTCRQRD